MSVRIQNRVLLVLLLAGALATASMAFLLHAPNRLVGGTPHSLLHYLAGLRYGLLLPVLGLAYAVLARQTAAIHCLVIACSALWIAALLWLAGEAASAAALAGNGINRTAFGGALWSSLLLSWLAVGDALLRLRALGWPAGMRRLLATMPLLAILIPLQSGHLNDTSLLKEYLNRQDVFQAALWQHLNLVFITLLPSLLIGLSLGVLLARRPRWQPPTLAVLNIIQTIPAIALFGLLIGPLAAAANAWPWLAALGLAGIGTVPAVIALTLYALLPVTQGIIAGLAQVPPQAVDAARGMGLTPRQLLWQVQLPLALPVFLAALRLTTIQLIGLAMLAALIGAGGFGAILFQGLLSSALDLVLLGTLPVIALTLLVDALFKSLPSPMASTRA
ncbi:ABC transporter permease [Chitinimonas naiadis]